MFYKDSEGFSFPVPKFFVPKILVNFSDDKVGMTGYLLSLQIGQKVVVVNQNVHIDLQSFDF